MVANAVGQRFDGNAAGAFQRHGALDRVLQLADVAGPVVNFQPAHGFRLDAVDRLVHRLRETPEKLARQQRNILAALAQAAADERE